MADNLGIGHDDGTYCPISGLPIVRRPQWRAIDLVAGYAVTFSLIGRRILLVAPIGNPGAEGMARLLEEREKVLREVGIFDSRYVEIKDFSRSGGSPSLEGRKQFTHAMRAESEAGHLLGFWGINAPAMVKWGMKVGTTLTPHTIPVKVVAEYRLAVTAALRVLAAAGLGEEEGTPESLAWSAEWPGVRISVQLCGPDVLSARTEGLVREEDVDGIYDFMEQTVLESGIAGLSGYYRILDWSRHTRTTWKSRQRFLSQMQRYNNPVPCRLAVIYGLNPVMRALVHVVRRICPVPLKIAHDHAEALALIEKDRATGGNGKHPDAHPPLRDTHAIPVHQRPLESDVSKLIEFIGSINWDTDLSTSELPENVNPLFAPIYDAVAIVKHDFDAAILERDNLQKQLLVSSRMASLGQLAAGVGHEINNPLTVILGLTEMLRDNASLHNLPGVLRQVEKVRTSADRIGAIVRSLKSFARNETAGLMPVDVHEAIDDILSLAGIVVEKEGVQLIREYKAVPSVINANRGHLQQIIINFLTNARDAMSEAEHKIARINTSVADGHLILEFADSGSGMSDEVRLKIFEPFYTTKDARLGTGLGLPLVLSFVEEMHGTIEVESHVGMGTLFRIRVPLAE